MIDRVKSENGMKICEVRSWEFDSIRHFGRMEDGVGARCDELVSEIQFLALSSPSEMF